MNKFFNSNRVTSYLLITFLFTFSIWFIPLFFKVTKDVKYALILLGICGPMIAGYVLTVINSGAKFRVHSKSIFCGIFILVASVLTLQLFLDSLGNEPNRIRPLLGEISILGYVLFTAVIFIISMNFSNASNKKLKENYLRSALFEKAKIKWYIFGFTLLAVISLVSYLVGSVLSLGTSDFLFKPRLSWIIGFLTVLFLTGGNEEFGWRGYMQKELQKVHSPLITAFIVSFFWSLWHLPLHYNGIYSTGGIIDLLPRFVLLLPFTIIYTWLYNRSSYALLALMIIHAMRNSGNSLVGYSAEIGQVMIFLFSFYCIYKDKMWKKRNFDHIYKANS